MAGRYYLKHMINHKVSNKHRNDSANENFKQETRRNAIFHLKNTKDDIPTRLEYLKKLTTENYRYGTKYKYKCNLNSMDIYNILKVVNDNELFEAYFGKSKETYDEQNAGIMACIFIFIFIMIIFSIIAK